MKIEIHPKKLKGTIQVPSSKSLGHRAIICASLAQGKSIISNISFSKDIEATIQSMQALGAHIQVHEHSCIIEGIKDWKTCTCNCNESGSTLRFILPVAATQNIQCSFTGSPSLFARPMSVYESIFKHQNLPFISSEDSIQIHGSLQADTFIIPGNISSQFISGLLFACPLLEKDSTIHILPPFESQSYIDLTIETLKQFHISIRRTDEFTYFIPGNQKYTACNLSVEGDYSQMAFFAVLGAIQNHITIPGMNLNSSQGDKKILEWIEYEKSGTSLCFQKQNLSAQTFDLSDCPDLGPIACVLAAYSEGTSHIIHAGRLRYKECDRIQAIEEELKKWNVSISSDDDSITIQGKSSYKRNTPVIMNSHNDHRIAMACCIFGLCASSPSVLEDAQAVEKSYPDFYKDIFTLKEM